MYGADFYGFAYVGAGEIDEDCTVEKSGTLEVDKGGEADDTVVYGTMDVTGGAANRTILVGGTMNVGNGPWGADSDTEVDGGGVLNVLNTGTSFNANVKNGTENVSNGGTSWWSTIDFGSQMTVDSGGIARSAKVNFGGAMTVDQGGVSYNATINGGNEYVSGIDENATLTNQGMQIVEAGGISWLAHAENNSGVLVDTGGIAAGATLDKNCWMYVQGGGHAYVTKFNGANASMTFGDWHDSDGAMVAGFWTSDQIDFRGMVAGPGMTLTCTENAQNTAATLTLKDAIGQTTSLTLLGQYLGADFSTQFDGHGGIAVTQTGVSIIGVLGGHLFV
jgi:autotransporter passenger strand-loop-strand repeat protein